MQLDNITVATEAQAPGKPDPACRFGTCCEGVGYPCDLCAWHSRLIDDREQKALAFLIEEQKRAVVNARRHYSDRKAEVAALRQAWQLSNRLLLEAEADAKSELEDAERLLRSWTLEAYEATGSKAPAKGVGVKLVTKLRYDAKSALDWAKARGMFLALDVPAFETFARNIPGEVPFVEITHEPTATIAQDLGKALEG
jgi:GNAT superfamily N-acetyltransferase